MLPKSRRFKTEDFKVFRGTRVLHTPNLLLRLGISSEKNGKAAVIVSSATYKKAVDRNLLRRRVYSVLEKHPLLLFGRMVTATVKKGALKASYTTLEKELQGALTLACKL